MADTVYTTTTNLKENIDGYEEEQEIVFYPKEKRSSRIKNTKVVVTNVVSTYGIHLDRENLDGVLDNDTLYLDAEPEDTGEGSVLCPDNTLVEKFEITDDLDVDNSTATISIGSVSFEDLEILDSLEIVKDLNRYLKSITIQTDNSNLTMFIKYDSSWVETTGKVIIPNNISHKAYYRILNNTGETQELTQVTCVYEFW